MLIHINDGLKRKKERKSTLEHLQTKGRIESPLIVDNFQATHQTLLLRVKPTFVDVFHSFGTLQGEVVTVGYQGS